MRGIVLAVLLALLLVPQAASAQSIRIVGDGSVQPGGAFTVTGDFQGEKPDSVSLSLQPGGASLGSAQVAKTGTWMLSSTVPASTSPGDYEVRQQATGEDGKPIGGLGTVSLTVTARPTPRPQQTSPEPGLPPDHFTPATGRDMRGPPYGPAPRDPERRLSTSASGGGSRATDPGSSSGGDSNGPSSPGAAGSSRRGEGGAEIPKRSPYGGRRARSSKGSSALVGPPAPASLTGEPAAGASRSDAFETPWDLIALGALACLLIISVGVVCMWLLIRGRPDGPSDGGEPRDPPPDDGPGPSDPLDVELQEMIAEERARRESLPRA